MCLFKLEDDPEKRTNLAAEQPDLAQKLLRSLLQLAKTTVEEREEESDKASIEKDQLPGGALRNKTFELREGLKKNGKKMGGFIQRSSDLSLPGRAIYKKNQKFNVFIIFINTKFGENFEEKIDICFFFKKIRGKVEVKKSD